MKTGFIYPPCEPATPVNLLDNSDVTNPVNQRGKTIYSSSGYAIDRWILYSGTSETLTVTDDGLVFSTGDNAFYQRILKKYIKLGKAYTLAYRIDESISVNSIVFAAGSAGSYEAFDVAINVPAGVVLQWVALYEGCYTADTLPPYIPKGYAAELAECQRFFEIIGNWVEDSKGDLDTTINSHKKRIVPTSTIYSNHGTAGYISGYSSGAWSDKSVITEDLSDTTLRIMSYNGNVIYGFKRIEVSADL